MSPRTDNPLKIIEFLQKADKPVIANHIAKGVRERPQTIGYHLQKLQDCKVILTTEEFGKTYYFLQPSFYLEDAETALMKVLLPWIEEFVKTLEFPDDEEKATVVSSNIYYYLLHFLRKHDIK